MRIGAALLAVLAVGAPVHAQNVRLGVSVAELEARARGQDSCDGAAYYNLAVGYISQRQWARADSALVRATTLDPQLAVAWLARSVVRDLDENYWRAVRRQGDSAAIVELKLRAGYSRRAYLIDPLLDMRILGSVSQFSDYSAAIEAIMGRMWRRFDDGLRLGQQGLVEGNAEQAVSGFTLATAAWNALGGRHDTLPDWIVFFRGLAYARANQLPSALQDFHALVQRNVNAERKDTTRFSPLRTNEYRYVLAVLQQRSGQPGTAAQLYREVITNDLGNFMAHVQMARLHEAGRLWDDAIAERQAAVDVNPEDHTLMYDLGAALARAGRWPQAEEALIRARDMQPRYPRTWLALGVVQQQLGRRAEAREALTRFVAIAPARFTAQVADAQQRLAQLQ